MAVAPTSEMAVISDFPPDPLEMFEKLLQRLEDRQFIAMNLANLDSEFGVLNRTVVYRGLIEGSVAFVTERNSRKYQNLKDNPKVGLTFFFPQVPTGTDGKTEAWQVRLIDAEAVELNAEQITKLWAEESIFAKIRSHICECGKTVDHAELQRQHDQLVKDYMSGQNTLKQTRTFTAFKILPQRWDFYKSEPEKIADRVQYRQQKGVPKAKWEVFHVAA